MYEYLTDAVVLHREPKGAQDSRVSFFTKRFGKLTGKATSARKITSKLSAHLEPGVVLKLRLVERHGLQIADALKIRSANIPFLELERLHRLLGDGEPDSRLWTMLTDGEFTWGEALRVLGWDARYATCRECGSAPEAFHPSSQDFFCGFCIDGFTRDEVLYIV